MLIGLFLCSFFPLLFNTSFLVFPVALPLLNTGMYTLHLLTHNTRGVQKVRSLIQLTTEYEHDILSLFNKVPFDRKNALGPVILQSPYAIVEKFLILVLQPATHGADNIIVVSKCPSFHEFFFQF